MRRAPVSLPSVTGMNDQFRQRILFINGHQILKRIRHLQTDTGLDGDPSRVFGKHPFQKSVQFGRNTEKTRTPVFGNHGPGGTAEIQVDLLITQILQLAHCDQKCPGVIAENLGDHRNAGVVFRQQILQLLLSETDILAGHSERGEVFVRSGKQFMMDVPEMVSGNAFHRSKVVIHEQPPQSASVRRPLKNRLSSS